MDSISVWQVTKKMKMKMAKCLLFLFLFQGLLLALGAQQLDDECKPTRCDGYSGDYGPVPEIRFPFWLKGHHADHCGYPGFALSCSPTTNETLLELPFSSSSSSSAAKVFVQAINYKYQLVILVPIFHPNGCFPLQYHLNLSAASASPFRLTYLPISPFLPSLDSCPLIGLPSPRYYDNRISCTLQRLPRLDSSASFFQSSIKYFLENSEVSVLSCPSTNGDLGYPISCPSSPGGQQVVYAVFSDSLLERPLLSCTKMYTIPSAVVPLTYSWEYYYYPYDSLSLSWYKPNCSHCESKDMYCRLKNINSSSRENVTECFYNRFSPTDPPTPRGASYPWTQKTTESKSLLVTGVTVGPFLLLVLVIAAWFHHRSNKLKKEDRVKLERFLEDYRALKPTRYTYTEIKKVTEKFKDRLGQGGYGTVYKGKLSNDVYIAAKILNNFTGDGNDFINEVGTIGRIHHVNIVRLVGYCADGYKKALVYEYLPNDSLEKLISSHHQKKCSLGWEKMNDIALGIARGIEYLHQGCDQQILHFDIKPHNILLDKNFTPKISDFGLAKLCSKEQSAVSMTVARGTVGYIAPEVFSRNFGNVSHKSDVYSFGMLLLEMVGGRKNGNDVRSVQNSDEICFPEWIYNRLNREEENGSEIEEDGDAKIVKKLTVVGFWCIQWYPGDRPSMKVVVQMLEGDGETMAMPPNPFSTTNPSNAWGSMGGRAFSSMLEVISESD